MIRRLRQNLRHVALNGLALRDWIFKREETISNRQIVQVVNFHHLYQREVDPFREFLTWFCKRYRVITYSQAVDKIHSGLIDGAYAAITFDDGLESNVQAGEILAEFGVSATFFVCPGIVGESDPDVLRKFCQTNRLYFESDRFVSWEDLEAMLELGHDVGSHTLNHADLSSLSETRIDEELIRSREKIERRLKPVEHFAWPFGTFDYLGETAARRALMAGYRSYGSGHRGAHAPHRSQPSLAPCIRRDNLEARWPLAHIKHFLINNAMRPIDANVWWPENWSLA